jgi:hypothetical protein
MATFPGAVKTFTTKNAGDVIQPADVNDLQDEVNAIEDGYLNGKAPLNSSNSTVRALSVTGGSTFAGNLVLNSSVTLTVGSTVGTAGQVLQSNGSSGLAWASVAPSKGYNSTWASVANSSVAVDALTFTVPAGDMGDGDIIYIEVPVKARNGTGGAQTPVMKVFWGGSNVTLPTTAQSGPLAERELHWTFSIQRYSTSLAVFAPIAASRPPGWWDDWSAAASAPSVLVISNSSFATASETVKIQIQLSTASALHYINFQSACVYKVARS